MVVVEGGVEEGNDSVIWIVSIPKNFTKADEAFGVEGRAVEFQVILIEINSYGCKLISVIFSWELENDIWGFIR